MNPVDCTMHALTLLFPLQTVGIGIPVVFVSLHYLTTGDKLDLVHALLGLSLTVLLTGIIVDVIKVSVGRSVPLGFC